MNVQLEITGSEKAGPAQRAPWRQVLWITLAAIGLYFVVRRLPTGTNLSHMDFRAGAGSIEFCDPANPQFMPVVAVRSPVEMTLTNESPAVASREARLLLTLKTVTGKPISPEDLLVVHTQKLHLLIVDPTLTDYQHIHPQPGAQKGEWVFAFTPNRAGVYRVFADFTPSATARGLYSSADLVVTSSEKVTAPQNVPPVTTANWSYDLQGRRFSLRPNLSPIRAGKQVELTFLVTSDDAGVVPLQPIMGAYAHLVAFDADRSGFAHLHPDVTDLSRQPDSFHPQLMFKLTIPRAGRYVIWAQVNLGGKELAVPFCFEVVE